jgi:hypothetical protein
MILCDYYQASLPTIEGHTSVDSALVVFLLDTVRREIYANSSHREGAAEEFINNNFLHLAMVHLYNYFHISSDFCGIFLRNSVIMVLSLSSATKCYCASDVAQTYRQHYY